MNQVYTLLLLTTITHTAFSQQTHHENFGNPIAATPVNAYTNWSNSKLTYSGTAELQTNNPSAYPFYGGGGGNLFFPNIAGTYFKVEGFPSEPYAPLYIGFTFGMYGYDPGQPDILDELLLEVSLDSGINWQRIPYRRGAFNTTPQSWDLFVANIETPVYDATQLVVRFTQNSSTKTFRIDDVIVYLAVLLPFKLSYFAAVAENNSAILTWTASSESSNEAFVIEKSFNSEEFVPVGKLMARGKGEFRYDFKNELKGKAYYRLKIIHADGKITYSNIVTVHSKFQLAQVIYPNPAKNQLHIQVNSPVARQVGFIINDAKGQTLLTRQIFSNEGQQTFDLDIQNLKAGIYYLTTRTSAGSFTERVVVIK